MTQEQLDKLIGWAQLFALAFFPLASFVGVMLVLGIGPALIACGAAAFLDAIVLSIE